MFDKHLFTMNRIVEVSDNSHKDIQSTQLDLEEAKMSKRVNYGDYFQLVRVDYNVT